MAEITINNASWNALSSDDKEHIKRVLTVSGLMKHDDTIRGTGAGPAAGWGNPVCKAACDIAQAAALAACAAIPGGVLAAACMAAAQSAGDACRNNC